ncbi:MAG TPA: glycosyltransferase family 1 protein [Patescibacteria group bacterium]|jgi:glycosyltransferase involved in cell wall biosynthesis
MVIGVDVREAAPDRRAGKGRVVAELVPRLARLSPRDTWLLFTDRRFDWNLPDNCRWRVVPGRGPFWHRRTAAAANRAVDCYFSPLSYLTPRHLKVPTVLFVHDLLAFSRQWGGSLRTRLIERLTLRHALRKAAGVVVNSEATATALRERYRRVPEVTVAPLAADSFRTAPAPAAARKVAKAQQLPKRYVLAVGTIEPRKNHARLIEAFRSIPESRRRDTALVIAGRWGWRYRPVKRAMVGTRRVKVIEAPTDAELAALYRGATVFAYPSLLEGFGLPVLEAMHAGAPAAVSDLPVLREVAGDAAEYVDPQDVSSIRTGIERLLGSAPRRRKLSAAGQRRAKRFGWDKSAKATLGAIREALDR